MRHLDPVSPLSFLIAQFQHEVDCLLSRINELGKPPEEVAEEGAEEVREFKLPDIKDPLEQIKQFPALLRQHVEMYNEVLNQEIRDCDDAVNRVVAMLDAIGADDYVKLAILFRAEEKQWRETAEFFRASELEERAVMHADLFAVYARQAEWRAALRRK